MCGAFTAYEWTVAGQQFSIKTLASVGSARAGISFEPDI